MALGGVLIAIGIWLIYSGYKGLDPIKTLLAVIQNPGSASAIIKGAAKPLSAPGSSGNAPGTTTATTQAGATVVAYARAQLGKSYRFGGAGPAAFDCSGLTMMAYKQVGVTLPHLVSGQYAIGKRITRKQDLLPGDIIYPDPFPAHCQIYAGNGNVIEAPKEGVPVRERGWWGIPSGDGIRATRPYVKG